VLFLVVDCVFEGSERWWGVSRGGSNHKSRPKNQYQQMQSAAQTIKTTRDWAYSPYMLETNKNQPFLVPEKEGRSRDW
jgi:hypothetical protein